LDFACHAMLDAKHAVQRNDATPAYNDYCRSTVVFTVAVAEPYFTEPVNVAIPGELGIGLPSAAQAQFVFGEHEKDLIVPESIVTVVPPFTCVSLNEITHVPVKL
jgi:hypothetical protein